MIQIRFLCKILLERSKDDIFTGKSITLNFIG